MVTMATKTTMMIMVTTTTKDEYDANDDGDVYKKPVPVETDFA
jgi:hypothetical protein